MRISFRLTLQDYIDAEFGRLAKNRRLFQFGMLAWLVVVVWYVWTDWTFRATLLLLVFAFFCVGCVLVNDWFIKYSVRRAIKKSGVNLDLAEELQFDISPEVVQSLNPSTTAEWSEFGSYSESTKCFILYESECGAVDVILPKRVLTPDQVITLRGILGQKLKKR